MILPVLIAPDRRLTTKSKEIIELTDELDRLLDDLYDTMIAHDGIGISACQVGVMEQVCVIQLDKDEERLEMINPKLTFQKGEEIDIEACLSLPYIYGTVKRAQEVTVEYFNREGELMEIIAQDDLARCIQHELDHLQGILFNEKIEEKIPFDQFDQWMEAHQDE